MEVIGLDHGKVLTAPAGGARIVEPLKGVAFKLGEYVSEDTPVQEFVCSETFYFPTHEARQHPRAKHDAAIGLLNLILGEMKDLGDGVLAFRKLPVVEMFDQTTNGVTRYGLFADAVIAAYILRPAGEGA